MRSIIALLFLCAVAHAEHTVVAPRPRADAPASIRRTPLVVLYESNRDRALPVESTRPTAWGPKQSTGTAIVVDERGYLLTCHHVVDGAREVTVALPGGKKVTAEVIASAPGSDMALLKVETRDKLATMSLEGPGELMIGETIAAIGNPHGYKNSLVTGIVSGVDRKIESRETVLKGMVQLGAPINPGNSGGPVLTIDGKLVGMVTAYREGAQSIGFAIPTERLREFTAKHLPR